MQATRIVLDNFTRAYIETALWTSSDESTEQGGYPMDDSHDAEDIAPETLARMIEDCLEFQDAVGDSILEDTERAGHDFWLTRNGHAAGFWDGDWATPSPDPFYEDLGAYLTAASKHYHEFNLYIGDDGLIHGA